MIGSPTRKALDNRLRRVHAAVLEFRRTLDIPRPHDLLFIALRDKQAQLWKRLEPRLARIKADAAQGCTPSLRWIEAHLEELGYVLARGELLEQSLHAKQAQSAEAMAECTARVKQAQRERDAYLAAVAARDPAPMPTRRPAPRVILQYTRVDPVRAATAIPEAASTPPSCDYGVGSEAWLRELEVVRRGGMPPTVGASRAEDVIPRK